MRSYIQCRVHSYNNTTVTQTEGWRMVLGLGRDSSRWLCVYFPVSWLTQFGHGLVTTVVGPTQPYLAKWVSSY